MAHGSVMSSLKYVFEEGIRSWEGCLDGGPFMSQVQGNEKRRDLKRWWVSIITFVPLCFDRCRLSGLCTRL